MQKVFKRTMKLIAVSVILAAVPPLTYIFFNPEPDVAKAMSWYPYSFVYATCIGVIASIVMPGVGCWVHRYHPVRRWLLILMVLTLIAITGSLAATRILFAFGYHIQSNFFHAAWIGGKMGLILTLLFGVASVIYFQFREKLEETTLALRTRELEKERALKLASEAQLQALESRIHPHFLFNSLNSVSALIQEDPELAERQIERISRFLRFSLDRSTARFVPVSEEMHIVSDYLEIERIRFGARLRYSVDIASGANDVLIPPMAVQTLVENSVKYAIAPRREGGEIRVSAFRQDDRLHVEVWDDGMGFSQEFRQSGHGLDLLEQRLSAQFGEEAALQFSNGIGMKVAIEVPCERS